LYNFGVFLAGISTFFPTMENPIDRTIRLLTLATGVVGLLIYVLFSVV
jgi:hypothetical protein